MSEATTITIRGLPPQDGPTEITFTKGEFAKAVVHDARSGRTVLIDAAFDTIDALEAGKRK